jgi:hypothetical protein
MQTPIIKTPLDSTGVMFVTVYAEISSAGLHSHRNIEQDAND